MKQASTIKRAFSAMISLFMPRFCIVCGRELSYSEKGLCLYCLSGLPLTFFWDRIGNPAEQMFFGRVRIERCCSLFFYRGDYKKCLYSIKYEGNVRLGEYLGNILGRELSKMVNAGTMPYIDYLVPVPLHWRKKWKRGYNQSEYICKGILKGLCGDLPHGRHLNDKPQTTEICTKLIKRVKFTESQTTIMHDARWRNVENAFKINRNEVEKILSGKKTPHIVLVDDVLTTGATIEACAAQLLNAFPCRISIATLAFAGG